MQQSSSSSSNTRHQFIRDALELAKQRLLTRNPSNASSTSSLPTNPNFMEIIVGVGYMLLVCSFLVKILFKTLGRFESHFGSSHDKTSLDLLQMKIPIILIQMKRMKRKSRPFHYDLLSQRPHTPT